MAGEAIPPGYTANGSAEAGKPARTPDAVPGTSPPAGSVPGTFVTAAPGSVRASDADRNALVERLAKATGEGRITLEEFADAAGAAYAAVTHAELDALWRSFGLVETLPPPPTAPAPSPPPYAAGSVAPTITAGDAAAAPPPPAIDPAGARSVDTSSRTERVVAIMSGADRRGRWNVRRRTNAVAVMGSVTLDLRDAVIESDVVEISACALMGGVTIIVPEGIPVELSGCVIMGGRTSRVKDVPILPGAPTIRVRALGMWGGVEVRSKPSRRTGEPTAAVAVAAATSAAAAAFAVAGAAATAVDAFGPDGAVSSRSSQWDHDHLRDRDRDRNRDRDRRRDRRPGGPLPEPTKTSGDLLTIVCTDIVGSTRLAVALGDQRWHAMLSAHNAMVRDLLRRHGGTEVKTSGDGFLITFTSARAALQFSMALQEAVAVERATYDESPLELRIGVHAGEVERDGSDVIGRNVTIACRLCDAAVPGEVLASAVVADLADSASDLAFGPTREPALAGIDRPLVARPATRA